MMQRIQLRIRGFRSLHARIYTTVAISLLVLLALGGCGTPAQPPTPTPRPPRLFPVPDENPSPEETPPWYWEETPPPYGEEALLPYCETTPDGSASGSSISISAKAILVEIVKIGYSYAEIHIESPELSCVPDLLTVSTSEPSQPLSLQFFYDGPHCYVLDVYAGSGEYDLSYYSNTGAFYSLDGNSYQIWSSYDDRTGDRKWWIEEEEEEIAFSAFADFSGALNDMSIIITVASGHEYVLDSSRPLAKILIGSGPVLYQVRVENTYTGETVLSDTGTIDAEDWSLVQIIPDFATRSVLMEEFHCP